MKGWQLFQSEPGFEQLDQASYTTVKPWIDRSVCHNKVQARYTIVKSWIDLYATLTSRLGMPHLYTLMSVVWSWSSALVFFYFL